MSFEAFLREWIKTEKEGCVDITFKLIGEDAPKNKFSIISGRFQALKDLEIEIDRFVSKSRDPQG